MDDIKLFAKNEKALETLIQTLRLYGQDMGMEFGIEKCIMPVMKSGKEHIKQQPNQVVIRTLGEKETYKYLGMLESETRSNKWKWKKKWKKSISEEAENYSRQNSTVGT